MKISYYDQKQRSIFQIRSIKLHSDKYWLSSFRFAGLPFIVYNDKQTDGSEEFKPVILG
jgi:hypothetical protein